MTCPARGKRHDTGAKCEPAIPPKSQPRLARVIPQAIVAAITVIVLAWVSLLVADAKRVEAIRKPWNR